MIHVRVVTSRHVDQDVEAHVALLDTLPRVRVTHGLLPLENRLALIVREATRLYASEDPADVVVTVGEAALVATMLAWRGPIVHLPCGALGKTERRLLAWGGAPSTRQVVVSSHVLAGRAISDGLSSDLIRVIRTTPPPCFADRQMIREKIGIAPDAKCILLAGRVRSPGGHRMALWASGILAFRDPTWRILIDPGEQADYVRRFSNNTNQTSSIVLCDQCSTSELAAAADVAVVAADSAPSYVALASAAAQRVPIVAARSVWCREQLQSIPAVTLSPAKARHLAQAILQVVDGARPIDLDAAASGFASSHRPEALARQWLAVLQTVTGRRRIDAA